jgi:hypothetical protein
MMSPKMMILYAWIQFLADAVDCGIHIVFHINCKFFDKVVIFLPSVDYEVEFTVLFQLQAILQWPYTSVAKYQICPITVSPIRVILHSSL